MNAKIAETIYRLCVLGLLMQIAFNLLAHRRATEAPLQGLVRATYLEEAP